MSHVNSSVCIRLLWTYVGACVEMEMIVCLFVFISSTMRFSRYGLGASYLATHNHSAIPEVTHRIATASQVSGMSQGFAVACSCAMHMVSFYAR
jgi:hypothetical protein